MKLLDLIEKLQNDYKEHGNIDCYYWPYSGQTKLCGVYPSICKDSNGETFVIFSVNDESNVMSCQESEKLDRGTS